jgi:hypothetical protein
VANGILEKAARGRALRPAAVRMNLTCPQKLDTS